MTGIHGRETGDVLDAYDFSGIEVMADIGGGNGSNIAPILQRYCLEKGVCPKVSCSKTPFETKGAGHT